MAAIKPFLGRAFEDHLRLVRSGTGKGPIENQNLAQNIENAEGRSVGRQSGRQQQDQYEGEEDDDLMEPTADDESNSNGAVSRVRVRRYR